MDREAVRGHVLSDDNDDDDDDGNGNENPDDTNTPNGDGEWNPAGGGGGQHGNNNTPNVPNVTLPNKVNDGPCVKIHAIRYIKDAKRTISAFKATAYNQSGNIVSNTIVDGYFLEPAINHDKENISGSHVAIAAGEYTIIPKSDESQKFNWYLSCPTRPGIAIHSGNTYEDTEGCLLPGESVNYNELKVKDSKNKLNELFNLFSNYGENNISIIIE